ncbi:MAG TPA: SulP family inorganic anion transporter [Acidimicrobiales bacterium]|nr:SulP family inorganic anion transporter [Acidimicrobiales bacterium]
MANATASESARTPIGLRRPARGLKETFVGVTRQNLGPQILAGVTLLAIAIPEQLATSQLAGVPAFVAMIAFITATLVFVIAGSNPIVSVGADSTIAPLFAVVLVRFAPVSTTLYMELVAATAVVTGIAVLAVGLLKLGWIADFLSVPIVTGFLCGIGVIIIVHQLPSALGVASGGTSIVERLHTVVRELGHVSAWSIALAVGTLVVLMVGEKINARLPWALVAIAVATVLAVALKLVRHGVSELGSVKVGPPTWHLHWLTSSQWGVVLTTSVTLVIVILSQTAATSRTAADELGVDTDLSRDFVGVGLANVAAGLAGAFPVNASPARTTVSRLAGGSTKLVGLTAAVIAILLSPLGRYAHTIPLAALAGVLFFIGARLIKIGTMARVWRSSRIEFLFGLISALGVIFIGVEQGIAIAVGLAIVNQTWRSARPHMIVLGRREGTTSWEPISHDGVTLVDHALVVLFDNDLFFANAGIFRREVHDVLATYPATRHFVIDAAAMAEIDFTGMTTLSQVVDDFQKDGISLSFARASDRVKKDLFTSFDPTIRNVPTYESVDAAVVALTTV